MNWRVCSKAGSNRIPLDAESTGSARSKSRFVRFPGSGSIILPAARLHRNYVCVCGGACIKARITSNAIFPFIFLPTRTCLGEAWRWWRLAITSAEHLAASSGRRSDGYTWKATAGADSCGRNPLRAVHLLSRLRPGHASVLRRAQRRPFQGTPAEGTRDGRYLWALLGPPARFRASATTMAEDSFILGVIAGLLDADARDGRRTARRNEMSVAL